MNSIFRKHWKTSLDQSIIFIQTWVKFLPFPQQSLTRMDISAVTVLQLADGNQKLYFHPWICFLTVREKPKRLEGTLIFSETSVTRNQLLHVLCVTNKVQILCSSRSRTWIYSWIIPHGFLTAPAMNDTWLMFSVPSAGRRVGQRVLQRHVQMFRTRRSPRLSGRPGAKGDMTACVWTSNI